VTDALGRLKAALADRYSIEQELGAGGDAARSRSSERQSRAVCVPPGSHGAAKPLRESQSVTQEARSISFQMEKPGGYQPPGFPSA